MAQGLLNLPLNIPWKQIAVSPDMMDTNFCDKRFPFPWRPSLAISVYEPPLDDTPDMCGERLTYLKVTATITGYQPTRDETVKGYELFPKVPKAVLNSLLDSYFGCYGALLNVAVFPRNKVIRGLDPRTVSFAASEVGSELANPYSSSDFTFQGPDGANRVVNLASAPGPSQLAIRGSLTVNFPAAAKVQATVLHIGESPVIMEVFAAGVLVDTQSSDASQGQPRQLESIERDGIDQVVLRIADGDASLLEITAFVVTRTPVSLDQYPHFASFEPQTRDLYQAATDTGEVLTASKSGVNTDKTLTHIDSTESGFSFGVKVPVPISAGVVGELSGSVSRKRTDTDEDKWAVQTDASRERRETQGTTTQISQMYNLLTGYYAGTNRATFLLLPRPHVLQPTDHRTFVQGLRIIEGLQEFLLIVSRPVGMDGICVEANLETGHFPEGEDPIEPPLEYDEAFEEFTVTQKADSGFFSGDCKNIEDSPASTFTISGDQVIDRRSARKDGQQGDPGHPGVKEVANNSNGTANSSLTNYNYRAISDTSVAVFGHICGNSVFSGGDDAVFNRTYRVLTRSAQPKPSRGEPHVPVTDLIITTRSLCVCILSGDPCPKVVPRPIRPGDILNESVVDERPLTMSRASLAGLPSGGLRTPALKELLSKIQSAMLMSWRQPRRYPAGEIGFLETDFFKTRVSKSLPAPTLGKSLGDVKDLPEAVTREFGKESAVSAALDLDLATFARRTGLSVREAAAARSRILAGL